MFEIGIDIVSIRRIREDINRYGDAYLEKMLLPAEIEYCRGKAKPEIHFAGTFAAKEAVWKALRLPGKGPILWKQIEISHGIDGFPHVTVGYEIERMCTPPFTGHLSISVSHCNEYAVGAALAVSSLHVR